MRYPPCIPAIFRRNGLPVCLTPVNRIRWVTRALSLGLTTSQGLGRVSILKEIPFVWNTDCHCRSIYLASTTGNITGGDKVAYIPIPPKTYKVSHLSQTVGSTV